MHYYEPSQRMTLQLPAITWAVRRLIIANAVIFALQLLLRPVEVGLAGQVSPLANSVFWFGFHPGLFLRGCLWQPLTYQFLHGGLMHLFMNMLWLFVFGPDVERLLGSRQFARFYIACGALGVLATLPPHLLRGGHPPVIGASGATMGVLVAFAMVDPERRFFMFPLPIPITAAWLVILVALFNVLALRAGDTNVSVATHFGGMIAGAALMKAISRYHRRRRSDGGADGLGEAVDNIFRFRNRT